MLVEFGRSQGLSFVRAARFFERGLHSIHAICVLVLISHRHLGSSLLRHIRFFRDMAESSQDLLRSAWLEGKDGGLPGREQAKAWALREMWRDAGKVHKQAEASLSQRFSPNASTQLHFPGYRCWRNKRHLIEKQVAVTPPAPNVNVDDTFPHPVQWTQQNKRRFPYCGLCAPQP